MDTGPPPDLGIIFSASSFPPLPVQNISTEGSIFLGSSNPWRGESPYSNWNNVVSRSNPILPNSYENLVYVPPSMVDGKLSAFMNKDDFRDLVNDYTWLVV
ncbi:hypothetical protein C5167_033037 [Papaver somniferum]|uniref:Uncharacterized protein n=1 Tax=Papaver somniferum TaxID=3469 RepID=A0A4Y7KD52_PAPSO|nr:hypothetical protein C5167_033037 [Papaver somniferum]